MIEYRFPFLQTRALKDPLKIYDGSNDQSTQIDKLMGNLGSFNISSTGNFLFIRFESDYNGDDGYGGFAATIQYGM